MNGQDKKREQKHKTNNFVESQNNSPLLTMFEAFARLKNLFIWQRAFFFRSNLAELVIVVQFLCYCC